MIVSCPSSPGILRRPSRRVPDSSVDTYAYDANGNLTSDEQGHKLVWDAWNRLVAVEDADGYTLAAYTYDGLGRMATKTEGPALTTHEYYNTSWQLVGEVVAGGTSFFETVQSQQYQAVILVPKNTSRCMAPLHGRAQVIVRFLKMAFGSKWDSHSKTPTMDIESYDY